MEIREDIDFIEYIIAIADESYNEDTIKKKDQIIEKLKQGEKDRAELENMRGGDYPEIEKIFIDFDRYCHSIEIGEESRKINPFQAKYIDGYKECYNDIRNRIRELIKERKK